jgi:hypothetical protein
VGEPAVVVPMHVEGQVKERHAGFICGPFGCFPDPDWRPTVTEPTQEELDAAALLVAQSLRKARADGPSCDRCGAELLSDNDGDYCEACWPDPSVLPEWLRATESP